MANPLDALCPGCHKYVKKAAMQYYDVSMDVGRCQPLRCDQECADAANGIIRDTEGFVVSMGPRYKVKQEFDNG